MRRHRLALRAEHDAKPRGRKGSGRTRSAPRVEILEQRWCPSTLYGFDLVAQKGQLNLSAMGKGPSINDDGTVAFVGDFASGAQGLFTDSTADGLQNINPSWSNNPSRVYGDPVEINNGGEVLAVDRVSASESIQYTLRTWSDSTPNAYLIYATAGGPSPTTSSLSTYASINDANDIVYSALDTSGPSPVWTLKYQSSIAHASTVGTVTGVQALRPVISDNPLIVARVGDTDTPSDPLENYAPVPILGGYFFPAVGVASTGSGFDQLGQAPGISDDGKVIAFAGDLTAAGASTLGLAPGPGIFARVLVGKTPVILRVAGVTPGVIQSFDLTQPVGTNGKTVAFLATDSSGNKGLFTAKLNIPGAPPPPGTSPPASTDLTEVAEAGGTITAGSTSLAITDISINHPINNSGQLVFWAATSQGDVIVRASGLSVDLTASQNPVGLGQSYTVSAEIENDSPSPITVDLSWAEIYPASPTVEGTPAAGDIPGISLGASASTTIPLGTFSHSYLWIPQADPFKQFAAADSKFLGALKTGLKVMEHGASQLVSALASIGDYLASNLGSQPQKTAGFQYQATLTEENGRQYDADALTVAVDPSLSKQGLYYSSQATTFAANYLSDDGVAALGLGLLPAAAVLLGSEVAGLLDAALLYTQAADPPDSHYTELATAVPIDMTELDSLPDGPWKQYGQDWLMLLADETAESTSQNRAEGAAVAGAFNWECTQLTAASGFASDVAAEYTIIQSLYTSVVEPYIEQTILPNVSSVVPYLQANGLPALEVKYLSQQGWSADELSSLVQNLIATSPDAVQAADVIPNALAVPSMTLEYVAQEQMDQATQIGVSDLGQPIESPTDQVLETLSSQQAAITAGLAGGVLSDSLTNAISSYLTSVYQAIQATNNPAALQDDLSFGQQALVSALALATGGGAQTGTVTATVALNADNPTPLADQAETFTVLVTPPASGATAPTGTVQFEVDGSAVGTTVTLANGMATSDSITLTAGAHTITADYSGDPTYAWATGSLTVTAAVPTATAEVTASSPLTFAGQPLTFTATATPSVSGAPTPTGTVQFEVDGSALGGAVALVNGAATSGSVTLTAGAHTVTAVYSGDPVYAGGPGSLALSTIAPGTFAPGSLDPTFGNQGVLPLKLWATNVAFDAEGRILVAGAGTVFANVFGLSRYTADGQPDHTFGSMGTVINQSGTSEGIAVEPDGKIVGISADNSGLTLIRFYDDGALDTTFGTDGVVQSPSFTLNGITAPFWEGSNSGNTPVRVATLPDGRILFAGLVEFTGVSYGCGLAMYLPNGQLDPSFNGTGTLLLSPTDPVDGFAFNNLWNLAVDNNKILLFLNGVIPGVQGQHIRIYAFELDGTTDTSFGTNGEVIIQDNDGTVGDQTAYYHYSYPAMALAPDGEIVVAYFNNLESYDAPGNEILLRYDPNGSPDATFGSGGRASVANFAVPFSEGGIGGSLAIEPDGKFLLIGNLGTGIVRVNSDGTLDTTFGTGGVQTIPLPPSLEPDLELVAVEPSGRILALPSLTNNLLFGSVGDPVVSFGAYTSLSNSSGTPTAVYDVSETAGAATITLVRAGDLSQPLSVSFSTDDSGGRGGVNYTPVNTTLTFAAGSATANVAIPILDDPNASPPVDVPLRLGTPSDGGVLGSVSVGDLHIIPVEGIVIAPGQLPSVMQGGAGSSFTVVLQSVPTANVTVPLSVSTTSPAAVLSASSLTFTPADALVPQTVTVTAGGGSGSSPAMATVSTGPATSADPKYNGLTGGSATVAVYPSSATSPGTIEFSAPNYTVDEDAGTATITLVRLGGSQGTVSVQFATSDDSPYASGKYTPLRGSVSFGPGVTSRQFSIGLINPGRNLQGDQTVLLTLSNPTAGAHLGVYPTATLTLHDTAQTRPGDLDPAFGDQGVSFLPSGANSGSSVPSVITLQPDGKIVAAGTGGTINGVNVVSVWRTDSLGNPDASFGQQGLALIPFPSFSQIAGVAIAPDGKIVVAGTINTTPREFALLRLNPDGTLDTSFGTDGLVTASLSLGDDFAQAMAVEPDGSILVAGSIAQASGAALGLVHFGSDGSLDIGFGAGGVISYPAVGSGLGAMLQLPDGKWLLAGGGGAGGLSGGGGAAPGFAVRLNADFSIDTTYGTNGIASLAWGEFYTCIALQPDGKILIGGGEGPLGGGQCTIGRLNPDGSLDTAFGNGGSVTTSLTNPASSFNSLIVQPDGKIVGIGYSTAAGGDGSGSYVVASRYLPDGSLDRSFAAEGSLQFALSGDDADSPGAAIALSSGDMVVTIQSDGYPVLAALLPETPPTALPPGQKPGQLAFAAPTARVVAGNTVVVTVDRFGGSDGTVSVTYTTQDSTAVAGTDYTAASGTLTFGPGVTSETLSISTLVDPRASANLSLDLVLETPAGGGTLGLTDLAALTITPASPQAPTTLTVTPATGTYGATATFTATLTAAGSPLAGEPVTFIVTAGGQTTTLGTATTDASGAASLSSVSLGSLQAGTYSGAVSASFAGDTSDAATTGNGDLTIARATPTVTWAMPADITQGQALGPEQLDATASVLGTFAYSPPAGTVLSAGTGQTLTAVFTPSDATDYKSVNKSTTLNVLSPTARPAVTGLSPTTGPTTGGTLVTITGTSLAGATAVDFGPMQVTSFISDTASQIILSSPAGTGTVPVTVMTASGTSAISSADLFSYFLSQDVASNISAVSGGGTIGGTATLACILTETSLPLAGKTISFTLSVGGTVRTVGTATTNANGIATLTGVSLAGLGAGIYSGAVGASFAGDSTYAGSSASGTLVLSTTPLPAVTAVSPATGPTTGGTVVTIIGTNLAGAKVVDFGPMQVTRFISDTAFQITLSSPAGSGTVPVTVMTASGTSVISSADLFSYFLSQAVLTNISAVSGGGTIGGTATLACTVTASSVPLAGKTVIFTLSVGGTVRTAGTATTNANGIATLTGASLAGLGTGIYSGAVGASFAGDSTYAGASASGTLVINTAQPLHIIGEQALFHRKTNKKGKPIGKPVLSGFLFDFSQALNPSNATNNANYQVDTVATKRVKNQVRRIVHPITSFSVAYSAANDSATLTFTGKQTFKKGGQIILISGSESGITAASGAELAGTKVFAISPRGQSIVAQ